MTTLGCFTCLNCGKVNPIKGHSFTNKYCNNKCQAEHRSRTLVQGWKETAGTKAWPKVPEWVKKYLIEQRGHQCETCGGKTWMDQEIPLVVDYKDGNSYNNEESNLELICPNCKSQK
jgi:hypothetical protein